jgi:hypothetical protein
MLKRNKENCSFAGIATFDWQSMGWILLVSINVRFYNERNLTTNIADMRLMRFDAFIHTMSDDVYTFH